MKKKTFLMGVTVALAALGAAGGASAQTVGPVVGIGSAGVGIDTLTSMSIPTVRAALREVNGNATVRIGFAGGKSRGLTLQRADVRGAYVPQAWKSGNDWIGPMGEISGIAVSGPRIGAGVLIAVGAESSVQVYSTTLTSRAALGPAGGYIVSAALREPISTNAEIVERLGYQRIPGIGIATADHRASVGLAYRF